MLPESPALSFPGLRKLPLYLSTHTAWSGWDGFPACTNASNASALAGKADEVAFLDRGEGDLGTGDCGGDSAAPLTFEIDILDNLDQV